jgi:DnaJ-class molecular chaperone
MKKQRSNPSERKCAKCNGTGFSAVVKPVQPGRRIYPAPCKKCGGKGRVRSAAD